MNKLDVSPPVLVSSPAAMLHQPDHRLIVLVSNLEVDLATVTHKIWTLANAADANVLFLGLYHDPAREPGLRRELVTMAAMIRDGRISAEADVIFGNNWADIVRTHFREGDTVVCFAEQRAGLARGPLSQILQSDPSVPLYILSGFYHRNESSSNWLSQTVVWAGSIAIVIGFFALQIKLDHPTKDWTHTALLLSIPFEFFILWVWNSLFD